jgi:alanine racemase
VIRPTIARIDLAALTANYRALVNFIAREAVPPPGLIAVVKANAYGHGSVPVAAALEAAGASMLACADIEEAVTLREAGIRVPILVFGALSVSDVSAVFTHDLTPTVSSPAAARTLAAAAAARGVRLRCHLEIDTGLNRLGFRFDNLARTLPAVLASPHLEIVAVYTHFASADDPASPLFDLQRRRFLDALTELRRLGAPPVARHAANSAALLRDRRVWFDYVRPGLLLYGVVPPPLATTLPLQPVMRLTSRVVAVKGVRAGESIGYGGHFVAPHPMSIAVVPAGYADGLDRRLAGRGHVLVRGRRAPIVGAVSMDMLTIDVTGTAVAPGDEVILLGEQEGERIDAREMAAVIDTLPYEVLCRIGSRIERIYN